MARYEISKEEIGNRVKNGGIAAAGAFGISALTSYRISQELAHEPSAKKVFKVSAIFAAISGLIWIFMPQARRSPKEQLDEVREVLEEPIKVVLSRIRQNNLDEMSEVQDIERRNSSSQSSSYRYSSSGRSNESSYMRGWRKVDSVFDDDVRPPSDEDDDVVTDDELEEIYADLEDKYNI